MSSGRTHKQTDRQTNTHTHTHTDTDEQTKNDFKKPVVLGLWPCAPGLKIPKPWFFWSIPTITYYHI